MLLEAGRFPSAFALAILSIEEVGKVSILRGIVLAPTDTDAIKAWKEYRSHNAKNTAWILPLLVANGAQKLDDFRPLFDPSSDHRYQLDYAKQLAFYTDCLGKGQWTEPTTAVNESMAKMVVAIAEKLAHEDVHSEMEIRLWIEHMGAVSLQDLAGSKRAVINWYAAMQRHGLRPNGPNLMEKFLDGGMPAPSD